MKVVARTASLLIWPVVVCALVTSALDAFAGPVWGTFSMVASMAFLTFVARMVVRRQRQWAERDVARWEHGRTHEAMENIPTTWLIDAFDAPESTPRDEMLAELDADTAWALARLHRKGVPAEYVAERWVNGEPLDADLLVASYREGGAA